MMFVVSEIEQGAISTKNNNGNLRSAFTNSFGDETFTLHKFHQNSVNHDSHIYNEGFNNHNGSERSV
jgi:hypothetical protein